MPIYGPLFLCRCTSDGLSVRTFSFPGIFLTRNTRPRTKSDCLNVFHPAIESLPSAKRLHVFLGLRHSRRREHLIELPLGEIPSRIEICHAMEKHPQIPIRMINVVRSRGRETEELPELNDNRHQREHDARQRHQALRTFLLTSSPQSPVARNVRRAAAIQPR